MANRKFTEQEMLTLRNSKYVLDVSPSIVHFSAEFKKLFWEELSKGRLPREIVSTLGIDPNILGDSRINGLKTMIGKMCIRDRHTEIHDDNSRFSAKVTDGEIDCHRSANCTVWRVQFHLYDCRCYPAELWQYGCCGGFAVFV